MTAIEKLIEEVEFIAKYDLGPHGRSMLLKLIRTVREMEECLDKNICEEYKDEPGHNCLFKIRLRAVIQRTKESVKRCNQIAEEEA